MAEKYIYNAESVSFSYGENRVLTDITLNFEPGRFYGIVGPNGSGKTTLLDLLIKNKRPAEGEILFNGNALANYSRQKLARQVALVPQEYSINFPFSVHEVVLMGRHPHIPRFASPSSQDLEIVAGAMEETGVARFKDKFITQLSGGEKQLVIMARALAQDTDVFILDEPTSNLDINFTLALFASLKKRVDKLGRTVIAVMHDLNLAAAYSDHLIFLKNGRVKAAGSLDEVFSAENVAQVFKVEAKVMLDEYTGKKRVAFRKEAAP